MMSSHQMSDRQVLDAIVAEAIRDVFDEYVEQQPGGDHGDSPAGSRSSGRYLPSEEYAASQGPRPGGGLQVNAASDATMQASCVEFVLAGLARETISA